MSEKWSELLNFRYGALTDSERCAAWESAKKRLQLGEWIEGEVVAVASFGAWIDYGMMLPGLLLIPNFRPALKPVGVADYPSVGDTMRCRLISFNEEQNTLVLTQDPESAVF